MFGEKKKPADDDLKQMRDNLNAEEQRLNKEQLQTDMEWNEVDRQIKLLEDRRQKAGAASPIEAKEEEYKKKILKYSHNGQVFVSLALFLFIVAVVTLFAVQWKVYEKNEQVNSDIENAEKEVADMQEQIKASRQQTEQQAEEIRTEIQELDDEVQSLQVKLLNYKQTGQALQEQEEFLLTDSSYKEAKEQIQNLKKKSLDKWEEFYYDGNLYYRFQQISNMEFYENGDGNTNVIYPGAVIRGDSLFLNNYTLVPAKRSGMTLTCNGDSDKVEEVNYAEVSKSLKQFGKSAEAYQKTDYYMHTVKTSEEVDASLGVSAGVKVAGVGGTASSSISKNFQEDKTNILVVVRQQAYTVTAEPLEDGAAYFAGGADVNVLGEYAPAYISEVTYGRNIVMLVSSKGTEEELKEALSCGVDDIRIPQAGNAKVSAEAEQEYSQKWSKLEVEFSIDVNGGNADSGVFATMTVADCMKKLAAVLEEGEEQIQNPVPISYELRYLADNSKVPCANIVDSWEVSADQVDVLELSWDGTYREILKKEVKNGELRVFGTDQGIDNGVVVLLPDNVISVNEGEKTGSILVVAPKRKDRTIDLNILHEKKGTKMISYQGEDVNLDNEKQLKKYGISVRNVAK